MTHFIKTQVRYSHILKMISLEFHIKTTELINKFESISNRSLRISDHCISFFYSIIVEIGIYF